ncbi:hypothetical protein BDW59DRAFT_154930 [Aspergillus cavernicola]|uniref:Amine oxidase domain-containing protein n=1 Tax=Aspergillus cavernicola TaxID=176166 RepID=A0ABR4HCI8_9EURO
MLFSIKATRLAALAAWLGLAFSRSTFNPEVEGKDPSHVITRNVCIIGGGASGTYAAVRLRQLGHSVILIERDDHLGGHTRTYYDPAGRPIDYGVWVYSNNTELFDFFGHFNIPLTGLDFTRITQGTQRFDLRTGQRVPPPSGDLVDAMTRYAQILLQHPYLSDGWDLPDPVPEDLLLPFHAFIEKYNLGPAVEILTLYVQGLGDILHYPAVYILKYFSLEVALGIQGGFSTSASRANQELYSAARQELDGDVLLSSTVLGMDRSYSDMQRILVQTPSGKKLIEAEKIIVTIPPLLRSLQNFDLDSREESIFGQFDNSYYYPAVVDIPGIPNGVQIVNRGADTPYNVPVLPGTYVFTPSGIQDLFLAFFGAGDVNMTENQVRETICDNALQLRKAGFDIGEPKILAYANHSPFQLFVSAEAIEDGFYRDLYSLQGHRNTYYTGAAWHAHSSTALWKFTERLLQERVMNDLNCEESGTCPGDPEDPEDP